MKREEQRMGKKPQKQNEKYLKKKKMMWHQASNCGTNNMFKQATV